MDELIKKKMEIAKRAGELNGEIERLSKVAVLISRNRAVDYGHKTAFVEPIYLKIQTKGTNGFELNSHEIDKDGTGLHDALLLYLNSQIDKRTTELNELIKVLS